MGILETIAAVIGSALGGGFAVAVVKRGEKRDEHEHAERKTEAREETARHRIDVGERARSEGVLERQLDKEQHAHGDCREALDEARKETEAARIEVAACARDRMYLHSLVQWLSRRLDKFDGGSIPPPPPLPDPDMELAE